MSINIISMISADGAIPPGYANLSVQEGRLQVLDLRPAGIISSSI
ncbi:MAG: hypothetical protein PXY39_11725 [archaeon]|nr:hypothetical protein [archaeon]